MTSKLFGFIAGVALLGAASQASAAIVTFTYTGTLSYGYDEYNTFGTGNTNLTGDMFSLVFTANTALGLRYTGTTYDEVAGGSTYGAPTPVTAVLTINSHSEDFNGAYEAYAANQTVNTVEAAYIDSLDEVNATAQTSSSTTFPSSLTTPFNIPIDGKNVTGNGEFYLYNPDPIYTFGNFDLNNVSSVVSPLPSTWSMLIAGFVGLGFFAYRGSKKNAALAVA